MGSVGNISSTKNFSYKVDDNYKDNYNYRDSEKQLMNDSIQRVKSAFNEIMSDSRMEKTNDNLYEAIANYFPAMYDNDAEKIVNSTKETVVTVDIRLYEDANGKWNIDLTPHSYSIDDWTDLQFKEYFGQSKEEWRKYNRK